MCSLDYTVISSFALITGRYRYCPVVRANLDIALWSGLYVIYNPVVSFDLRCQSGICHNYFRGYKSPLQLYKGMNFQHEAMFK